MDEHYVSVKIDALSVILSLLEEYPKGLRAKEIMQHTGLKRNFLYKRLNKYEEKGYIKTYRKKKIKARYFKITEVGKHTLHKHPKV